MPTRIAGRRCSSAGLGRDRSRVIAEGLGGRTTVLRRLVRQPPTATARASCRRCWRATAPLDLRRHHARHQRHEAVPSAAPPSRRRMGMRGWSQIIRGHSYGSEARRRRRSSLVSPPLCIADRTRRHARPCSATASSESHVCSPAITSSAPPNSAAPFSTPRRSPRPSPLDGVHLDAANTRAIGKGLVPVVESGSRTLAETNDCTHQLRRV